MVKSRNALKFISALACVPLTAAAATATLSLAVIAMREITKLSIPLSGAIAYCPLHFYFRDNKYFYVLAHELSHAFAAFLTGTKIKDISVSKNSGFVALESTSVFISLAPYFIPLYTIISAAVYAAVSLFYSSPYMPKAFTFIAGFFLSFHLLNTAELLAGPLQSDFKKAGGFLFSFSVVLSLNCLFLALALKLFCPDAISLAAYLGDIRTYTTHYCAIIFHILQWITAKI